MQFRQRTLEAIANMICGNNDQHGKSHFEYRSSFYLSRFFEEAGLEYRHDKTTRHIWVADTIKDILAGPQSAPNVPPAGFCSVIRLLMDPADAVDDEPGRPKAMAQLNLALSREGYEAFYADDGQCYLRHVGTQTVATSTISPHRPLSSAEIKKREILAAYLDKISEDELIEDILLPLFRQLGFHRVTAAGHKDKALEYGKDVWMRFTLPTQHLLYFGLQAKIGKLDAAGNSKNTNMAEIHNQALMMLGHEIFDPETSRRVAVAFETLLSDFYASGVTQKIVERVQRCLKDDGALFKYKAAVTSLFEKRGEAVHLGGFAGTPDLLLARRAYALCLSKIAELMPLQARKVDEPIRTLLGV